MQLVQAFDTTDAHGRYQDKLNRSGGRFPSGAAPGQANSIAERTGIEIENDRRICKQLADSIAEIVRARRAGRLVFCRAGVDSFRIVDLLPPAVRDRIVEHVKSDLVKIEPAKLPGHFRSLQPM